MNVVFYFLTYSFVFLSFLRFLPFLSPLRNVVNISWEKGMWFEGCKKSETGAYDYQKKTMYVFLHCGLCYSPDVKQQVISGHS